MVISCVVRCCYIIGYRCSGLFVLQHNPPILRCSRMSYSRIHLFFTVHVCHTAEPSCSSLFTFVIRQNPPISHRCRKHLSHGKAQFPPQAFWCQVSAFVHDFSNKTQNGTFLTWSHQKHVQRCYYRNNLSKTSATLVPEFKVKVTSMSLQQSD